MEKDPASQAQLVHRSGLAALVGGMFGMGWLGWGLGLTRAFNPPVIVLFDVLGALLLGFSIYFIRKGRTLRRNYPTSPEARAKPIKKQFTVIVILEFIAIAILGTVTYALHRPDLAPVLAAIVVGLHFLPIGRLSQQSRYYFWGMAIAVWCSICAILFRSNTLIAWSNIGTGVLLWANCTHGLLRAREMARALVPADTTTPALNSE